MGIPSFIEAVEAAKAAHIRDVNLFFAILNQYGEKKAIQVFQNWPRVRDDVQDKIKGGHHNDLGERRT